MTDTPQPAPPEAPRAPAPPPPGGRAVRVVLALSLALNLLVAGMVLGAFVTGGWGGGGPGERAGRVSPAASAFVGALEPEQRRALGRALAAERELLRATRREMRARAEEALRLLRSDPFDAAAFAALLADQRAAQARRQQLGERLLVERLSAMNAAERAAYADRLADALRRGAGRPRQRP